MATTSSKQQAAIDRQLEIERAAGLQSFGTNNPYPGTTTPPAAPATSPAASSSTNTQPSSSTPTPTATPTNTPSTPTQPQPPASQPTATPPATPAPVTPRPVITPSTPAPAPAPSPYITTAPEVPKSLQEVRQETIGRYQSVIDATQALYNTDIQRIGQQGTAEKARTSSMAVGAGLAGSPFQQTMEASVQSATDRALADRTAQRTSEVSNLMLAAENQADEIYQRSIDEYQEDLSLYISERDKQIAAEEAKKKEIKDTAVSTINSLAKSGYSIDEIPREQYQKLLTDSGMSDFEARATWAAQTPAANATYTVQNGFMVGTYFDPVTQKPVVTTTPLPPELQGTAAPDLKNITLADGSVIFYDANDPYNVDGTLRTINYKGSDIRESAEDEFGELLSPSEAAALGVPYGTTKAEAFGVSTAIGGLTKDQRAQLNTIQDNARQDENIKTFAAVRASYETARSAAENPDHGVGDLTLLRMLAKITDPTTGVQSSEFSTFEDAQGAFEKLGLSLTKKMWQGDRLTEEARAAFLQQAEDIYKQREAAYQDSVGFYEQQAAGFGIPEGMVIPVYTAPGQNEGADTSGIQFNKSYASPDDVAKDYPELQDTISALRQQYSDGDILQFLESEYGSESFSKVGADTNQGAVTKLSTKFQPGSKGGQCGRFVNQHTGLGMGDSIESKLAKCDPSIGTPENPARPGDVFVTKYSWTGHTGFIKRTLRKLPDGTIDYEVIDSNYGLDEKVKVHVINSSKMAGFARVPITV